MHDIAIRGGSIIDGLGNPAFTGDVAITGDRIVQVGGKAGPARRNVDATGKLVTPGWVDVHTHYDGQATWDKILGPSSWHGVTTIMFGNCGVGFAPCRPQHRTALIDLMEGVEDIPGIALAEGLKWDWQSFPDYLDALERLPRTIDIAAQVPHHPLRVFVMGERAINREVATEDDIDQCGCSPNRPCAPAPTASRRPARTCTRRRPVTWFLAGMPRMSSSWESGVPWVRLAAARSACCPISRMRPPNSFG